MGNSQVQPVQLPPKRDGPPVSILKKPSTVEHSNQNNGIIVDAIGQTKTTEKSGGHWGNNGLLGIGKLVQRKSRNKQKRNQRHLQGESEPSETLTSQLSRSSVSENTTTEDKTIDTIENVKEKEKLVKPADKEKESYDKDKSKEDKPRGKIDLRKKCGKLSNQLPKEELTEFERIKVKTRPAKSRKNATVAGAKNMERLMMKNLEEIKEDDQLFSFDEEEKQMLPETEIIDKNKDTMKVSSNEGKQSNDCSIESADYPKDTNILTDKKA